MHCNILTLHLKLFYLTAQSNGGVSEGLPLPFKSPPLTIQLCRGRLKTFPFFQKIGVRELEGKRRDEAVLKDDDQNIMFNMSKKSD